MTYQEPKYPLFVDIDGAGATVIGAGQVAERKIETLLHYGARVRVISLSATPGIKQLAQEGKVDLSLRAYRPGDLKDAFLVICATDDREVNERVFKEAQSLNILVNVVDVPELCNFYVPSIVKRGPLQIAISTSGAAPTVAKRLRKELSEHYGPEWGTYVSLLGEVRSLVLARVPGGEEEHKPLFTALAKSDLYDHIASGELFSADQAYDTYIVPLLDAREGDLA